MSVLLACEMHSDTIVVFDRAASRSLKSCPLCNAEDRIAELERELESLQNTIIDLQERGSE